jgi:heat shock protein HslJ
MNNSNNYRIGSAIAGLLLLILLAACAAPASPTADATSLDLADTTWKLDSVNNAPASSEQAAIVYFGGQGALLGTTGCNVLSGSYQTSGSSIDITINVVTSFTCSDALTVQEEALVQTLTQASTAQGTAEQLNLSNPDSSLTADFTSMPPAGISGTSWKLNAFNNGQGAFVDVLSGTEITANFGEDGTMSGTAGCNNYTTQYTVDGSSITIGMAASTMMMCAEPSGIMEQETQYLAAIQKATSFVNLGAVLYLADAQNTPVAYYSPAK